MKVDRKQLLSTLESVSSGLSKGAELAQSDCFVFKNNRVVTFNESVYCSTECLLDFEGAVPSEELLGLLRRMKADQLDLSWGDNGLVIEAPGDHAVVAVESRITLPVDGLEQPDTWNDLPPNFWEAVSVVQNCCSNKRSRFILTCVHIHPDWVEASDKFQISRYGLKTGWQQPVLISRDSLNSAVGFNMTQFGETENWTHFRNVSGLQLSCRRYVMQYPDLTPFLRVEGSRLKIPNTDQFREALECASVFSGPAQDDQVIVELRKRKLRVVRNGARGSYRGVRECEFDGDEFRFAISPALLMEISKKTDTAIVAEGRLKVETDKWVYVTVTSAVDKE